MINAFFSYKKQLFVVAGVVATSSLFYGAYTSWRHRQDKKASDAYAKALSHLEKLEDSSKTEKDNDKQKQRVQTLETARQAFRQVRLDCPSCRVSRLAALNEAQLSLQLGQHEQALKTYQTLIQNCVQNDELCAWALLGKARAQEAWGKQKEALETLEKAATQWQKTAAESFVQWHMVRLAYHLGQQDKLQTYATQMQERFPNVWMSQQAKQLIQQSAKREDS
ncbi:MAG: tetratricopeptide repeat protein [Myxococcota bacterium]